MLMCRSEGSLSQDIRKKIALFASLPPRRSSPRATWTTSTRCRSPSTSRASTTSSSSTSASQAPAAGARALEGADRALRARRRAPCGSRSSASTCSSRTPTCRCPRRCATPPRCRTRRWRSTGSTPRAARGPGTARRSCSASADGILIPGGFGGRGIEGKIAAARVAREQRHPLSRASASGMQVAVAEFARNVAGMEGANSTEFDIETPVPGDRPAARAEGGRRPRRHDAPRRRPDQAARRARARGRCTARRSSTSATATATRSTTCCASASRTRPGPRGTRLRISGTSPDERLVEMIELEEHPFFVASQFHPEFKSRPERPAPLFRGLHRRRARARRRGARRTSAGRTAASDGRRTAPARHRAALGRA